VITLDQIRLLEGKITKALDLVRALREENSTLRKGLESAQKRMKELETTVDSLKTDQREIESIIVRTLHNLDDLEETAASTGGGPAPASSGANTAAAPGGIATAATAGGISAATAGGIPPAPAGGMSTAPAASSARRPERAATPAPAAPTPAAPGSAPTDGASVTRNPKEELDIF